MVKTLSNLAMEATYLKILKAVYEKSTANTLCDG